MKSLQHQAIQSDQDAAVSGCISWCVDLLADTPCVEDFVSEISRRIEILEQVDADIESKCAVVLYSHWTRQELQRDQLNKKFGQSMADLAYGVKTMDAISSMSAGERAGPQMESIRKMLITMIDDVRVVMIRLACQLDSMREAKVLDEDSRLQLGKSTLEVFAPLANRLGIWQFKWELEDLDCPNFLLS